MQFAGVGQKMGNFRLLKFCLHFTTIKKCSNIFLPDRHQTVRSLVIRFYYNDKVCLLFDSSRQIRTYPPRQLLWLSWQSGPFRHQRSAVRIQSLAKFYHVFTINCIEKTKITEKEAGNGPFKKIRNTHPSSLCVLIPDPLGERAT